MNSEYVNQNAYDAIQVHGGSGFIMEYKSQRLYRDARIFSIYEGTTQLQVVAAIRYITNGTYLGIIKEMLDNEVSEELKPLRERVVKMTELYEQAVNYVKEIGSQEAQDFAKSANVYVRYAEEEVVGHYTYIKSFIAEDLVNFRAAEAEAE